MKTEQSQIEWKEIELNELAEIVSGSTPSTLKSEYWNGNINWITPAEIGNGNNGYYYETQKKITKEGLESASINIFPKGTVMLTSRAPIGKVAIAGTEMCSNQGFKNFICKKDQLVPEYLYYWLRSKEDYLNSIGHGATFKEISKSVVSKLKIPIPFKDGNPNIEEQNRIVQILENAEKLKERGKKANDLLDEYLKSVFHEMFYGEGFEEVRLGDICETTSGGTPSRAKKEYWENGKIPWIKSGDLNKDRITEVDEFITEKGLRESSAKYIDSGTVLIAMYGATAGKTSISKIKATTNQAVCALTPRNNNLDKIYLLYWLRSNYSYIVSLSFGGGQPNISQQVVRSLKIPLPPLPLQQKFSNIVEQVEKLKENVEKSNMESENLFNSLMHKAFRGELE